MSRVDEADLVSKFISALTLFSERTSALETRVLTEMGAMRNDIQQLKQTIATEHNTVSLPKIMEQQRITMIELIRQIQPIIASAPASLPIQHTNVQPPNVAAIAPIQQPIIQPSAPLQPLVAPIQPSIIQQQPPTNVAPIQPKASGNFGDEFRLKEGEWYCGGCYVKNAAALNNCACCTAPKPGTQSAGAPKSATNFRPQTFGTPTGAPNANLFGVGTPTIAAQPIQKPKEESPKGLFGTGQKTQQEQKPVSFSFAPKSGGASPASVTSDVSTPQKTQEQKPVSFSFTPQSISKPSPVTAAEPKTENKGFFGGSAASPAAGKPLFGGGSSGASFATLAGNNTSGNSSFLNKSGSNAGTFNADPKQFQLFGGGKPTASKKQDGEDDGDAAADETAPEEFAPDDTQFKRPDIALPDLVEVKTGEENEEVMFNARCRLYRYLNGEVKERGTGDLKLLKNRETGKMRCVMRREQVLKLCANFSIPSTGFTVNNTKRGENVLTWACNDFSDSDKPEGEPMTLICRFKDVETAKKFKEITQSA
ncbi:hypothetical protein M3Y97_00487700 [Aphelenchoides bicaudatus]|nr:hypothetical protein M3Y97_00487700 [Aphelenchoides bicaudatus]